jgi:hypothetical protein
MSSSGTLGRDEPLSGTARPRPAADAAAAVEGRSGSSTVDADGAFRVPRLIAALVSLRTSRVLRFAATGLLGGAVLGGLEKPDSIVGVEAVVGRIIMVGCDVADDSLIFGGDLPFMEDTGADATASFSLNTSTGGLEMVGVVLATGATVLRDGCLLSAGGSEVLLAVGGRITFLGSGRSSALGVATSFASPSTSPVVFASLFGGGAFCGGAPLGGAPVGFAPGGLPDGGRAAPRILATDALGAALVGGGPFGGGSDDLARTAATADVAPCGGGFPGGGSAFFFFFSPPSSVCYQILCYISNNDVPLEHRISVP